MQLHQNDLAGNRIRLRVFRPRFPKPEQETTVTLIIGIICGDWIVVASDSQTSYGGRKRNDTEKIDRVKFKNGEALIAQAGDDEWGTIVVEHVKDEASQKEIDDRWALAYMVDGQVDALQRRYMRGFDILNSKSEDFKNTFEAHKMSFLMAYYHEQKPSVYIHHFPGGRSSPRKKYVTLGCGGDVADFILRRFDFSKMNSMYAAITAIYVVQEVIKVDHRCDLPVRIGIVSLEQRRIRRGGKERSTVYFWPQDRVDKITTYLKDQDAKTTESWLRQMNRILQRLANAEAKHQPFQFDRPRNPAEDLEP